MELFILAGKNVFRNPRRSVLNILGLTIGLTIMILGYGWVSGYHTYIYTSLIDLETGHAQFVAPGYLGQQRRLPTDIVLENYSEIRIVLEDDPRISAAGGRLDFPLYLETPGDRIGILARAVDTQSERIVSTVHTFIDDGSYFDSGPGILLGKPLANYLDLEPGDVIRVSLPSPGADFRDIVVRGIFHLGYPIMDRQMVFLDLPSAWELLGIENRVNRVVVRLAEGSSPEGFMKMVPGLGSLVDSEHDGREGGIPGKIASQEGRWFPWQRFAETAVKAVEADSGGFAGMIFVLYVLIVLGILNSLSMGVHERTREIGTLRALGMGRGKVQSLFILEALIMAGIAVVFALVLSIPGVYFLQEVGVDLTGAMPDDLPVPFGDRFRGDFQPYHFFVSIGITLVTAGLGAWLPARKAGRVKPAEALRATIV